MAALSPPILTDDKYELIRELGHGEAAVVYEAKHRVIDKRVALKLMNASSPSDQASVLREARAAARIGHPNVIDILDSGVDTHGRAYVVMELLAGETLADIIQRRGPLPVPYACELMLQVLSAMAAAHAAGVIHRDLKPANVFVTHPAPNRPVVKVLDFGLAETGEHIHPGAGTPAYMPPEQAMDLDLDGRADVFSVSVMLYELISGQLPFRANSLEAMFAATFASNYVPLTEAAPAVAPALASTIELGMAGNRERRIASAEEMADRIRPFATSTHASSGQSLAPIPLVQRRRMRTQLAPIAPGPLADAIRRATQYS
jgi:serine/threonine-protein kinase